MSPHSTERKSPGESSFCHPAAHEAFDLDALLRALAHPCRREVLCLLDAEPTWTLSELAANLGTVESVPTTVPDGDAELALHHRHLPLLVEAGLVERDVASDTIERGESFGAVREMVDAAVAVLS